MKVEQLIALLRTFPKDAEVLVRHEHDDSYSPGSESWDPLWPKHQGKHRVFYCKSDNTVNSQ
jgi:hypothetical protein